MLFRKSTVVFVLLLTTVLIAPQGYAEDASTLAAMLSRSSEQAYLVMDKAGDKADDLQLAAAAALSAAIQNTAVAYSDKLQVPLENLPQPALAALYQVRMALATLEQGTPSDARHALQVATQVNKMLPASEHEPRLSRWDPEIEAGQMDGNFNLSVFGRSLHTPDPALRPYLLVANERVYPAAVTNEKLTFQLARTLFHGDAWKLFRVKRFELVVPYQKPQFLGFLPRRAEAHFFLSILGLPPTPGTIQALITRPTSTSRRRHVVTPQASQESDLNDRTETHCGPNETDLILNITVRFVVDKAEGTGWSHQPQGYMNPAVCETVHTENRGPGRIDRVWFHFEYDVVYFEIVTVTNRKDLTLKWGESELVEFPPYATFQVVFASFDGAHYQASDTDRSNRYITVEKVPGGVRISVKNVRDIWPLKEVGAAGRTEE